MLFLIVVQCFMLAVGGESTLSSPCTKLPVFQNIPKLLFKELFKTSKEFVELYKLLCREFCGISSHAWFCCVIGQVPVFTGTGRNLRVFCVLSVTEAASPLGP